MTALESYESFLLKVNRGDVNSNIHVPRGKYILIYNEQSKNWLKSRLKQNLSTDDIDEISDLLVDNQELTKLDSHQSHVDFQQPNDYFRAATCVAEVTKGECKKFIDVWNIKPQNLLPPLRDSNYKPSFDYEETIFSVANKKVRVFYDGFKINKVYLSYYRFPSKVDIEGYINLDGSQSENIDPDINDDSVNEIVTLCALEFQRNNNSQQGFPFAKDRTQQP